MQPHTVRVPVIAPVCVECDFWREEDGWFNRCPGTCISVHGSGFEDAKRQMENALSEHLLDLLRLEKDVSAA
jgi:hypothetical protein